MLLVLVLNTIHWFGSSLFSSI